MYIREITKACLNDVEKLYKDVYNKEEFLIKFEDSLEQYSYGVYSNGILKGYIIANAVKIYDEDYSYEEYLYIEDLVCKNPLYLRNLLLHVMNVLLKRHYYFNKDVNIVFQKNDISIKLFKMFLSKFNNIKVEKLDYISEDVQNIYGNNILCFNLNELENFKFKLSIKEIINTLIFSEEISSISDLIPMLLVEEYSFIMGESFLDKVKNIKQYKKYILKTINIYNMDKWANVAVAGESINMQVAYIKNYSNPESLVNKMCKDDDSIEISGSRYVKKINSFDGNKKIVSVVGDKSILIIKPHTDTLKYSDFVSSYRRFFYRKINFLKNEKGFKNISIYDKYGEFFWRINYGDTDKDIVPYNFSNVFDNVINKNIFMYKVNTMFEFLLDVEYEFLSYRYGIGDMNFLVRCACELKTVVGEEDTIVFLTRLKEKTPTEIHDWIYIFSELLSKNSKKYLTKGAYKSLIFNFSLKSIQNFNSTLNSIIEDKCLKIKKEDVCSFRKNISKAIRNKELNMAIKIINLENQRRNEMFLSVLNFSSQEFNKNAISFVNEMNRYNENINLGKVISHFGKNNFKRIIEGKVKGIFKEDYVTFEYNYSTLGLWIKNYLKENRQSKKASKLFNGLRKITSIDDIYKGVFSREKYNAIINELKIRNINAPKHLIQQNEFYAKVEKKCSPNFLIAGDASVCCMSFGQEKSKEYALEEGFGIINVYYKNRIVANSLIWINDYCNCLILDNIEVAPNYKRDYLLKNIKELFFNVIEKIKKQYNLNFVVQGTSFNDLELYKKDSSTFSFKEVVPKAIKVNRFYSDANFVKAVDFNDNELKVEQFLSKENTQVKMLPRLENQDFFEYDMQLAY